MGDLVLKGATSGQITLTPVGTAGTNTLTLPARTGNIITSADTGTVTQTMLGTGVAGNGPAFSAYQSASQSVANTTLTKVQFQTEEYDTANCFDNATNYRFTPNVAGYYQVNGAVNISSAILATIYKNAVEFKRGIQAQSGTDLSGLSVSCCLYLNGSTDYIELYVYQSSGSSQNIVANSIQTYFQASLVRAA